MRSLADSIADGVLADAILIPHPQIPPTNIRKVRGLQKSKATSNTKTIYLVNEKRRCRNTSRDSQTLLKKVRKQGMSFQLPASEIKVYGFSGMEGVSNTST